MNISRYVIAAAGGWALMLPGTGQAEVVILKVEPPAGQVRYGNIVYVDDGSCPAGEIKEIAGGSAEKSIPRRLRCVKHPK